MIVGLRTIYGKGWPKSQNLRLKICFLLWLQVQNLLVGAINLFWSQFIQSFTLIIIGTLQKVSGEIDLLARIDLLRSVEVRVNWHGHLTYKRKYRLGFILLDYCSLYIHAWFSVYNLYPILPIYIFLYVWLITTGWSNITFGKWSISMYKMETFFWYGLKTEASSHFFSSKITRYN